MKIEENILFKDVDADDCHRMIECLKVQVRDCKAGSCIADYSRPSDTIGIILSGSAVLVKYDINGVRTIIEKLEPQSLFGEFFTFSGMSRDSIEVICETDCEVMLVKYADITKRCEKACRCHSKVVENLLKLMSEKAIALNERIEVLSQRTIEDKLITYLRIVAEKTPAGKKPRIPFSMTALSDYLCVNRSALQREISKLKKDGTLTIKDRYFQLYCNPDS